MSIAVLVSYTLFDWDWQQQYGNRNYWVAGGVMMIFAFHAPGLAQRSAAEVRPNVAQLP